MRFVDYHNNECYSRWPKVIIFENERRKLAVKVVDIFGNDTMTIVDVSVGKNGGRSNGEGNGTDH